MTVVPPPVCNQQRIRQYFSVFGCSSYRDHTLGNKPDYFFRSNQEQLAHLLLHKVSHNAQCTCAPSLSNIYAVVHGGDTKNLNQITLVISRAPYLGKKWETKQPRRKKRVKIVILADINRLLMLLFGH